MLISYKKLWKILIDKNMNKTQLRLATEISSATLAKLSKNEQVSMDVLLKICEVLDCDFCDIIESKREVK